MNLVFLGTGPLGGVKGQGKSARFESSVLIKTPRCNVLIDVTNFFEKQSKWVSGVDAILITHAHEDAVGGISQLRGWRLKKQIQRVPLFSLPVTLGKIKQKVGHTNLLDFIPVKSGQKFNIDHLIVTPFLVHHSIQAGFPTLGFHFLLGNKKLVYASDVSGWNAKAEKLMRQVDILVIDGAMWGKKMIAHLDIKEILPKICHWPVKKIIFTQIGHTAPKHEILQKEIEKICPKALPAHDGMRLKI